MDGEERKIAALVAAFDQQPERAKRAISALTSLACGVSALDEGVHRAQDGTEGASASIEALHQRGALIKPNTCAPRKLSCVLVDQAAGTFGDGRVARCP